MKQFLVIILSMVFLLCLTACGNAPQSAMVKDAVEELQSAWEEIYDKSKVETDGYFEIKNTRVVEIKNNSIEEFEDVDYIIEFVIYTDYYGAAPYYSSVGISDSVVVHKDGDMEVSNANVLRAYSAKHYSYDYSDIVKAVIDCGDQYNCIKKLK